VLRVHTFGRLHVRGTDGVVAGAAAQPRRLALLGQAIYALRQDLGADEAFLGGREDLRLNPEVVSSDVGEFSAAVNGGRLETAASQYTGAFLDGFHLPGAPEFER
jgi:hypothetical protein